jgi:hypothetical protein
MVPVWTPTAESHYILCVRHAATADQTQGEDRFAVAARRSAHSSGGSLWKSNDVSCFTAMLPHSAAG